MTEQPEFPPLLTGVAVGPEGGVLEAAVHAAKAGTDAGQLFYRMERDSLSAALVLAPEVCLGDAMAMVFAASLGAGDALGALGPPELAFHFVWPAGFQVNGGSCGGLRAMASSVDPDETPDWIVLGLDLPLWSNDEPGLNPNKTVLFIEGFADISPVQLLEAWARHTLVWIHRWESEGMAPLHAHWMARTAKAGDEIEVGLPKGPLQGAFVGLDDRGGLLLKTGGETRLLPLTEMLEPDE